MQAMPFALIFVAVLACAGAGGYILHRRVLAHWLEREKNLLRMMREQELASAQLEVAHRTLEQRARELARSNAELERFAHIASHDLKEPVRTVVSYTQLLARKYAGALDANAQEYIRDAAAAALSIRSRLEGFLEYAEAGAAPEGPAASDSTAGIEKALEQLRPDIARTGAVIHCEALPAVRAQESEVATLFQHLIDNAIKFRSKQTPAIQVSAQRAPDPAQWLFSVRDNGIGVDSRHADKIFGLFQRLHAADEYPGMGLGLALCRKIVEARGGRIWVEPADGGGSCFRFTLPAP